MRLAEAKITHAVAAARQGDLEQATTIGNDALDIPRRSVPSLILVGRDLATELDHRYHHDEAAAPLSESVRRPPRSDGLIEPTLPQPERSTSA